jgi:hypothetical protein
VQRLRRSRDIACMNTRMRQPLCGSSHTCLPSEIGYADNTPIGGHNGMVGDNPAGWRPAGWNLWNRAAEAALNQRNGGMAAGWICGICVRPPADGAGAQKTPDGLHSLPETINYLWNNQYVKRFCLVLYLGGCRPAKGGNRLWGKVAAGPLATRPQPNRGRLAARSRNRGVWRPRGRDLRISGLLPSGRWSGCRCRERDS